MNKRITKDVSEEWLIESDNISKNDNISYDKELDNESDNGSDKESDEESEYYNLREKINELLENQPNFQNISKKNDNTYCYSAIKKLKTNLEDYFIDIQEKAVNPIINICAYHINTTQTTPFLEYFLFKEPETSGDFFHFPRFNYIKNMDIFMKSLTIIEIIKFTYNSNENYEFNGYVADDNNLYMFFDCSSFKLDAFKMSRINDLWMVTIDEIINQRKVCNFPIENEVTNFFEKNLELLYLTNETGDFFETPTVLYSSIQPKKIDFTLTFGISPETNEEALFGKYYYFTDYKNAANKEGINGVIRCAVFLGKMKVVRNNTNDVIDESIITQGLLLVSQDITSIKMFMRISDRDALWTNTYNSVYLGKVELDDGSVFKDYPLWCVKDYEQQTVLSAHIIYKKLV
jgi:hypothetical protein